MNPNFQLNVDSYKINSWLQDRKKLPKDWQIGLKASDAKLKTLLEDPILKEFRPISNLIHHGSENFGYPSVLEICKELQSSRLGQEKNFIGKYTNPTLKGWLALREYMKKNLVGLLHTARLINQLLKFDLPGLKKNKESISNQIVMLRRKIDSNNNSIYQNRANFVNQCKRYSIKGDNIREEIPKLVEEIPSLLGKFEGQAKANKGLVDTIKLYREFCRVNGSQPPSLRLLEYFCNNGDDLLEVYEGKEVVDVEGKRQQKYDIFKYDAHKQWSIQVESEEKASTKYETLLSNRPTRLQLINDLNQLSYFYLILQRQLKSGDTHLLSNEYLKLQPSQQLMNEYNARLKKLLEMLGDPHFNQLLGMYENPQSSQRLCSKLQLYATTTKRFEEDIQRLLEKIGELECARDNTQQDIERNKVLIDRAHKVAEEELTQLMKREIRLVGDINKVQMEY